MFLTMHSYSQLIMHPYGGGPRIQSRFYNDQLQIAWAGQRAVSTCSGVHYQVGTMQQLLSSATRVAVNWAHESGNIKYSYGTELRDKGQFGFMLPASHIASTGEEWYRVVAAMINDMTCKENERPVLSEN
ncbi:carboxypeptidase A2-like [Tropilaelaps mercedesae]|uniref:Carboxypeptidase A2-like n=1 Tax=Tropilaelaps mercedesae TaxID=418985 RepID=A0A1V9X500_9ACAR|nr:carboxypeptidase A2-like [Tropilaelaps mercedesae]